MDGDGTGAPLHPDGTGAPLHPDGTGAPLHPDGTTRASPSIVPVLVPAGVISCGVGMIFPLLARFQDTYGFSTAGLGLISGASFVAALVSGLLLANLADRGHARRLLVGGLLGTAVSVVWFSFGTELWQFVSARGLQGLAAGVFIPAARKVVAAGDPLVAGKRLGLLTSAELAGFMLGPVLGATLSGVSLQFPFEVLGVTAVVLAVVLARVRLPHLVTSSGTNRWFESFTLLRRPRVAGAALLSLALFLPVGLYDAMWARYLTDRGASTFLIGLGLSLYAVPVILFAPWGGRLADRHGPVRVAVLALCAVIPMTVGYGLLTVPVLITALAVAEGVPQAVANPAVQAAMLDACEPDEAAAGQGLAYAVNQIGAGGAALAAPLVYAATSAETLFVGVGVVMALILAGGTALSRRAVP